MDAQFVKRFAHARFEMALILSYMDSAGRQELRELRRMGRRLRPYM